MSTKNQFLEAIKTQRKESKSQKKFSGNFLDYLELVQKNPDIVKSSHKRLFEALVEHGVDNLPDSDPRKRKIFDGNNVRIYDYFNCFSHTLLYFVYI